MKETSEKNPASVTRMGNAVIGLGVMVNSVY